MIRRRPVGGAQAAAAALAVAVVVLVGLAAAGMAARPAGAQTAPPATCTTLPPGSVGPVTPCPSGGAPTALGPAAPPVGGGDNKPSSGLMDRVLGAPTAGGVPLDHYDMGYDEGGSLSVTRKVFGFLLDGTFATTRWLVSGASLLVEWAFKFTFADALARPAGQVAATYQSSVVVRLGLVGLAWFAALCWCGFHALRGRLSRGGGELAVSFVIAVVAATFFTAPSSVLLGPGGALDQTRQLALEVADVTTTTPGAQPGGVASGRLTASLRTAFVEQPHQILNWGVVLDDGAPAGSTPARGPSRPACLTAYKTLIASGPHGTSDEPRKAMTDAGCEDLAKFNDAPTPDRLVAAVLVLVAAILVCLLMILVAITLAAAQLGLAALVVLAPFAFSAGIVPGGGRAVLIRWVASAAKALAAVVMTAVFLGLLLVTVTALVAATNGQPLLIRMAVLDLVVLCAFVARSRLLKAGKRAATNAARRAEGAKVGGSQGRSWMGPAAVGGVAGFGATELLRENADQLRRFTSQTQLRELGRRLSARGSARGGGSRGLGGPSGLAGVAASGGPGGAAPGAAAGLQSRLAGSRSGRAVRLTTSAVKVGLASTIGAPVYLPRATKATKAAVTAKRAAVTARATRTGAKARSFGDEYVGNLRAGAHAATRAAVRVDAGAAQVGRAAAKVGRSAAAAPAHVGRASGQTRRTAAAAPARVSQAAAQARSSAAEAPVRVGRAAARTARSAASAPAAASARRAGEDLGRANAAEELRRRLETGRKKR